MTISIRNEIISFLIWILMVMLCLSSCVTLQVHPPQCETHKVSFGYYDDVPYSGDTLEYEELSDGVIEWPLYPSDLMKYQEWCVIECVQPTFEGFINWLKSRQ